MRIRYRMRNTPAALPNFRVGSTWSDGDFAVSEPELMWSAISFGKDSIYTMKRSGYESKMELSYRASLIRANLLLRNIMPLGDILRSPVYLSLDPTEKGAVSYFIGSAMAKFIAKRLYDVDWLMHMDVYGQGYAITAPHGKKPDFFGIDRSNRIHIIEAKGSSGKFSSGMQNKARTQVKRNFISHPRVIASKNIVQAHFSASDPLGYLSCRIEDPEPEGVVIPIEVDVEKLIEAYYFDMYQFCRDYGDRRGNLIVGSVLDSVTIGMDLRIFEMYSNKEFGNIFADYYGEKPESVILQNEIGKDYLGSDGIYVLLDREIIL